MLFLSRTEDFGVPSLALKVSCTSNFGRTSALMRVEDTHRGAFRDGFYQPLAKLLSFSGSRRHRKEM